MNEWGSLLVLGPSVSHHCRGVLASTQIGSTELRSHWHMIRYFRPSVHFWETPALVSTAQVSFTLVSYTYPQQQFQLNTCKILLRIQYIYIICYSIKWHGVKYNFLLSKDSGTHSPNSHQHYKIRIVAISQLIHLHYSSPLTCDNRRPLKSFNFIVDSV